MERFHEPTPTEYDGVKFRSKGEAIFAKSLYLHGFLWEYEPERLTASDGWVPDFLAVWRLKDKSLVVGLIEYKPSTPTDSYLSLMQKRVIELGFGYKKCAFTHVVLAAGNSFSDEKVVFELGNKSLKWRKPERTWLFDYWDQASRHRFDLTGGGK